MFPGKRGKLDQSLVKLLGRYERGSWHRYERSDRTLRTEMFRNFRDPVTSLNRTCKPLEAPRDWVAGEGGMLGQLKVL